MAKKKSKSNGPTPPVTPKLASFAEVDSPDPPKPSPPADDPPAPAGLGLDITDPQQTTLPAELNDSIATSAPALSNGSSAAVVDLTDEPSASPVPAPSSTDGPPSSSPSERQTNGTSLSPPPPPPPTIVPPEPSQDASPPAETPQPTAALASATSTLASLAIEPAVQAPSPSPRPSLDLARPSLDGQTEDGSSARSVALEKAYDKLKTDKDTLEKQYRALVAKVGVMRDTLGKKLKEDAVSAAVDVCAPESGEGG